jgi:hypothetical protein
VSTPRGQAALLATVVVVSVLTIAIWRETATGAGEIAAADAEAARGHWPDAIAHARAAAEAAAPASPWSARGFSRLDSIGRDATARGDEPTARLAYAAMRTAAVETRSPWSDRAEWALRAEAGLSRLAATGETRPAR